MTIYHQLLQLMENTLQLKFPPELISLLKPLFHPQKIVKGDTLLHAGELPCQTYILIDGLMRSYYIDSNGNDITQYFLEPSDLFGFELLTQHHVSPVTLEALEDCLLMATDGPTFSQLIFSHPFLIQAWIHLLETGIQFKIDRQSSFLLKNATERYLDFQRLYPGLEQRVRQSDIASYLWINPVSLSRIRHQLYQSMDHA